MNPYHEKRSDMRNHYVTTVMLKDLKTGKISRARMVNCSSNGMYFEANVRLKEGEIIEIGIENSPYIPTEDAIDCYKVAVIRRKRLASGVYTYGYGLQKQQGQDYTLDRFKRYVKQVVLALILSG